MAGSIQIDATGMNNMIRALRGYNNVQTRVVVRAVTKEILALAATRTATGSRAAVIASIEKNFRKPHEVPGIGHLGITRAGKVWVHLNRWGPPIKGRWRLLNEDGSMRNASMTYTDRSGRTRRRNNQELSEINRLLTEARQWRAREGRYRRSMVGMSKATWYETMRRLNLPIPARAPRRSVNMVLPASAHAAIRAWETTSSRDNYSIGIQNAVQATLNRHARGIGAFRLAFNGKVREFERATENDVKTFARRFAERNGFSVS